MRRFRVEYVNSETGRNNKRTVKGFDRDSVIARLESQGHELQSINELVSLASREQLAKMKTAGISAEEGLTREDAEDLLNNAMDNCDPAHPRDREHARYFGVYAGRFANKKRIYLSIYNELVQRSDLTQFAQWYVYRVYRSNVARDGDHVKDHPQAPEFGEIAQKLMQDSEASGSLMRNRFKGPVVSLRWFGEYVASDGSIKKGASTRTAAYKYAYSALCASGLLPVSQKGLSETKTVSIRSGIEKGVAPEAPGGCFPSVAFLLVAAVALMGMRWVA